MDEWWKQVRRTAPPLPECYARWSTIAIHLGGVCALDLSCKPSAVHALPLTTVVSQLPVVTRTYVTASFLTTAGCALDVRISLPSSLCRKDCFRREDLMC